MTVNFMGLIGPDGHAAAALHRAGACDACWLAIARCGIFWTSFHHRLISLFYQAWQKYRFPFRPGARRIRTVYRII